MRATQKVFGLFLLSMRIAAGAQPAAALTPDAIEFFEKNIRPILVEKCEECHSAKAPKLKGGLRVDYRDGLLKGGDSGPAVVPGNLEKSLLIKAVRYTDPDLSMPPDTKLSAKEIAALEKWVLMQAPDPRIEVPAKQSSGRQIDIAAGRMFWSFQPLSQPRVPDVSNKQWAAGDIDRFILKKLEDNGRAPAKPADRRTLIRRANFDLTGLPPTPEEIDAFIADDSPDAFAKVVDRLLACPRYGERVGRNWLDLVRYADSRDARGIGGLADIGEAWRYRDWVVNALNRDMPYDEFIIHQIAGDLLREKQKEGIYPDGIVATGLLAIGEWGAGDADKEKMMTDIVDDQVDVVTRGFLGVTLACARCHDHKFDPFTTRDYYALAGMFFSSHIIPAPGKKTDGSPMLRVPLVPDAEVKRIKDLTARPAQLEEKIQGIPQRAFAEYLRTSAPIYVAAARERAAGGAKASAAPSANLREIVLQRWIELLTPPVSPPASSVVSPYKLLDKKIADVAGNSFLAGWRGEADCPSVIANPTDDTIAITTLLLPPHSTCVHPGPKDGVAVCWKSPVTGPIRAFGEIKDADDKCGDGIAWKLQRRSRHGVVELAAGAFANGGSQSFSATSFKGLNAVEIAAGDFLELLILPKENHFCDTTFIDWNIESADGFEKWNFANDTSGDVLLSNPYPDKKNRLVWHFMDMTGAPKTQDNRLAAMLGRFASEAQTAAPTPAALADLQTALQQLDDATLYREFVGDDRRLYLASRDRTLMPEQIRKELEALRAELAQLRSQPPPVVPVALAAQEGGVPESAHAGIHDARVHVRGSYTKLGDVVPRNFPEVLRDPKAPVPKLEGSGRLELARWIASKENPLTARVMANRIWQQHFGQGLVRTPSNFGKLGTAPTHPELLDWLARRLIDNGWSMKALHREIMLSSAYRQSCETDAGAFKADPENKLFGRMNRRRIEAEVLRDSLRFAAGTLDLKMGGPSDKDANTPRRMLYLMSVRSDRSSFGPVFDAAEYAAQVDTRTVSIVAPQALYMLNNALFFEQCKALAARVTTVPLKERGEAELEARMTYAYKVLFGREPLSEELGIAKNYFAARQNGKGDSKAVWTEYLQILACSNEFMFVE